MDNTPPISRFQTPLDYHYPPARSPTNPNRGSNQNPNFPRSKTLIRDKPNSIRRSIQNKPKPIELSTEQGNGSSIHTPPHEVFSPHQLENYAEVTSPRNERNLADSNEELRDVRFSPEECPDFEMFYRTNSRDPDNIIPSSGHNLDADLDRLTEKRKDEGLDALTLAAQTMVYNWKTLIGSRQGVDDTADVNLQVASLLALFVSDRYGGSDRSSLIQRAPKGVSGSNYSKPFVCTCSTGSGEYLMGYAKQNLDMIEDAAFPDIFENSFRNMKARINSCIIPIGALQFGLCRHRAILMKYLYDRMDPPVPCEIVRGYLDFCPHAWNVVLVKRRGTWTSSCLLNQYAQAICW